MYKDIFILYGMEKYLREASKCHQEISVKYSNDAVETRRVNFGFETCKMKSVEDFLLERLGPDKYNKVVKHFRREISQPKTNEYMMIGFDGQDYEVYVEYGTGGRSYDIRKDTVFEYIPQRPSEYYKVYNYLKDVLPEELYDLLSKVLPKEKCHTLYAKASPFHRCVYLFRPRVFPQVKSVRDHLYMAAKVVNREHIPLEDSMYLSYIGIGIGLDSRPELAYYFRRTRGQEVTQAESQQSEAREAR